jgi:hypothetical protein
MRQQNTTRVKLRHALSLQLSHNISSHYIRDLEATLPLPPCLYSPTTGSPGAEQYCATSTPLLDVRPTGRNQDKLCVPCCLASTIEG